MKQNKKPQQDPTENTDHLPEKEDRASQLDERMNTTANLDELTEQAEKERTKKPGSQSQSNTSRHNNGRGGGK